MGGGWIVDALLLATPMQDARLFQDARGIAVIGLQQALHRPLVFPQQRSRRRQRNAQSLRDVLQATIHFGHEIFRRHHADGGGSFGNPRIGVVGVIAAAVVLVGSGRSVGIGCIARGSVVLVVAARTTFFVAIVVVVVIRVIVFVIVR